MEQLEKYLENCVRKHRLNTKNFSLNKYEWGKLDPMIRRIKDDLFKEADKYPIPDQKKKYQINRALKEIESFYNK